MFALAMLIALLIDVVVGWPARLYAAIGHPVTWLGRLITVLDHRLNRPEIPALRRRLHGILAMLIVIAAAAWPAALLQQAAVDVLGGLAGAIVLTGVLAWPLIAVRSMHDHVAAVAAPLISGDLAAARSAVAMIVGRDVTRLDEAGVARAAIESLAENTSDGIVAPVFWGVLLGLPGIAAYKAINTLDSMIGHRTERHAEFGWASARLDDAVNLLPARLTGVMFALVSGSPAQSLRVMLRDGRKHRSPNAGYPEAAMAGALNVRLSGPRIYEDRVSDEPWLNAGAPDPVPRQLAEALGLYRRTMILTMVLLASLAAMLLGSGAGGGL